LIGLGWLPFVELGCINLRGRVGQFAEKQLALIRAPILVHRRCRPVVIHNISRHCQAVLRTTPTLAGTALRGDIESIRGVAESSADLDGHDFSGISLLEQWLDGFEQN
jgi:hypothetical protein